MSKNYYRILGVDENAMAEQIKKAHCRKVMKMHPNMAQGEDAAERFKELSEAYEMFSNPNKRAVYSQGGDPLGRNGVGGAGGFDGTGFGGFNFSIIMDTVFGGQTAGRGPRSRVQQGQNALVKAGLKLHKAAFECTKSVRMDTAVMCPKCQGSDGEPGSKPMTCNTCRGQGEVTTVRYSLTGDIRTARRYPTCQDFRTIISNPCGEYSGEGWVRSSRGISVYISVGVSTGNRARLEGRGEVGRDDGPTDDLRVESVAAEHERFRRDGDNLEVVMTLSMTAATLGISVELTTLETEQKGSEEADRKVAADVPARTQSEVRIPLKGQGVPRLRGGGRGDLGVTIVVETPRELDEKQCDLLHQLAESRDETMVEAKHPGYKSVRNWFRETFE